jgi:hypothetical protein
MRCISNKGYRMSQLPVNYQSQALRNEVVFSKHDSKASASFLTSPGNHRYLSQNRIRELLAVAKEKNDWNILGMSNNAPHALSLQL